MSLQVEMKVSCEPSFIVGANITLNAILLNFLGDVRSLLVASTTRHYGFLSTKL